MIEKFKKAANTFIRDEEGASAVEYALVIAVASLVIVIALSAVFDGSSSSINTLTKKIHNCLATTNCS